VAVNATELDEKSVIGRLTQANLLNTAGRQQPYILLQALGFIFT
jgi:hypothetical protein